MNESIDKLSDPQIDLAWYRHLWPWLLMLPPLAAVCGGIMMIWLATSSPAQLVVEDYAQIEAITAARFAADAQAARYGLTAEAVIDRANPEMVSVSIRLSEDARAVSGALHLRFQHATDAALDRDTVAREIGNEFRARVNLGSGTYLMEIEPPDGSWRLAARLEPSDRRIELSSDSPVREETSR